MKTIIFDVDGTLVDSVALHAESWQKTFARYGKKVAQADIRAQVGKGGDKMLRLFFSTQDLARFGKKMLNERDDEFGRMYLHRVRPFPQVEALMKRLHNDGFSIALGSSGKKKEIRFYMRLLGIEKWVDSFTTSEDAAKTKPDPDIFEAAIRKMGSPPKKDILVVGDSPYDAQAAARAGVTSIGVLSGGFSRTVLKRAGCFQIFRDPADLLRRYSFHPWPW